MTLLCDGVKCAKTRVSDVEDMRITFMVGEHAVAGTNPGEGCDQGCGDAYQVPFSAGLPGIPVSGDFYVDSAADWGLRIEHRRQPDHRSLRRRLGHQARGHRRRTIPAPTDGDSGCPDNPLGDEAFGATSPFKDYTKSRCQSLTLGILQGTAYDGASEADRSQLHVETTLDLGKLVGTDKVGADDLAAGSTSATEAESVTVVQAADGKINLYFVTGINPGSSPG